MDIIHIEHVSFTYRELYTGGRHHLSEQALSDVSLQVPAGEFLCLVGHSGSGKSTLLRLIAGLEKPASGRIFIEGTPAEDAGLNRAVVFQNYSLFPWMNARRNVEFGISQANRELGRGLTRQSIKRIAEEYLQRVGMIKAADKYPYQLSGGMRQRVAIARALAMETPILLFDEPFGALDLKTRTALQELVENLWRSGETRKTIVFITHDIDEALLLADRIVFLRHGEILDNRRINIKRPRSAESLSKNRQAAELKKVITELFYLDPELDVDDEACV